MVFLFSSGRRHTRFKCDWSSDVCSSDLGARYIASQHTSYESELANEQSFLASTRDLPGYTIVDATLGYSVSKWLVQLNAHNIFDKKYYINNYQTLTYGNVIGDPANFFLSVRRQF